MWFDQMAIPADAQHVDEAHEFLNYMMKPEVAAKASNYVFYANGNKASQQFIDKEILDDPAIYPDEATLAEAVHRVALRSEDAARRDADLDQDRHRPMISDKTPAAQRRGLFLRRDRGRRRGIMKSLGSIRRSFAPWTDPAAKPYISSTTSPRGSATSPPSTTCRWRSTSASSSRCSARPAAASRRCCACSPASTSRRGPHPARRPGSARHPALPAAGQHDVPVLRAVPAHDGRAQHRLRPQAGRHAASPRSTARVAEMLRAGQARAVRQAQAAPAFRRPAPARRAGPLGRQAAEGAAARRAARRARQEAARGDAVRTDGPAAGARPDLRRRHPRPGRGDDHGRPHRHHGQGRGHAGRRRRPRSTRRRARASSPTSSAT